MISLTDTDLFVDIQAVAIASWATLVAINNLQTFSSTAGTVGRTMSMALLRQSPVIETPLLRRATTTGTSFAAHAALAVIVLLQLATAFAMWGGFYLLVSTVAPHADARPWLNAGVSGFASCAFILLFGGLWFGYWIRQEGLQLTHIALVVWSIVAYLVFNHATPV